MQSKRWEAVSRIFHKALELDVAERPAFVALESGDDDGLRSEVERLLQAHVEAASWLSRPALAGFDVNPTLAAGTIEEGDLLCDRFLIRRQIAAGGMGTVYEAYDQELHTPVALKVVLPEIANDPEVVARFRREVALARRITHTNICRTFDLERTVHKGAGIVFLTMEFLQGRTLAERLRAEGPLDCTNALHILRQIAQALAAAHSLGVVHRDIKPGNIMLLEEGSEAKEVRAVVTDFGLARLAAPMGTTAYAASDAEESLTRGYPIGTLSYMAPEQLEGLTATVATDVYALGLVTAEMLSGTRVFAAHRLLNGMAARLDQPSLATMLPSQIPAAWISILERCLNPKPEDRYPDTLAFLHDLETTAAQPPRVKKWSRPTLPALRKQWLAISGGVLLIAAALFGGIMRLVQVNTHSTVPAGATVYLAPLTNRAAVHELDQATTLLASQLSQSTHVQVLEQSRIDETLRNMKKPADTSIDAATAREIALRTGAVRVIFPSIEVTRGGYTLSVTIDQPDHDPSRSRTKWTREFRWQAAKESSPLDNAALAMIREAGDWVREKVGESADDIARLDIPPEDATTANWQALDEYAHGERLLLDGKTDDGITALERATQLDREFSLAYARLGDVLVSMNRWRDGLAAYREAISTTSRQRLSRRELDRVRGIYASDTHDFATAEAQFRDLASYYPSDWLAWFYRALPLMRLGRIEEAIECLKHAHALVPQRLSPTATLAQFSLVAGDQAAVAGWIAELRRYGYPIEAAWIEGEAAVLRGDTQTAEDRFNQVSRSTSPSRAIAGYQLLAHVEAEEGRLALAQESINKALLLAESGGEKGNQSSVLMDRAWLRCQMGQITTCAQDADNSLAIDHSSYRMRAASLLVGRFAPTAGVAEKAHLLKLLKSKDSEGHRDEIGPLFEMAQLEKEGAFQLAQHHCETALKAFRAEAAIDAAVESRMYLAQSLEQCAEWETSSARGHALRREAADAYAYVAFRPALIWIIVSSHPPGSYVAQLSGWIRTTDEHTGQYAEAEKLLRNLRSQTSPHGNSYPDRPAAIPRSIH
ncbi:protein kinase [Terriglobus albidus]|uniref:Protein kinase n=1 Tax=Terriglobus albidus TaxID=1592106 RepID=A0A5B9E9G6_9BACT|nr:serine/threonine-protein kinase [Terriglobus albidus]QEE27061.1 protein kinase [Terriglobus albidus]